METKISKVKNVEFKEVFHSNFGDLNTYAYEMEDGTTLTANHKEGSFKVGDTVEYGIKGTSSRGAYGKVGKPQQEFTPRTAAKKGGNASFALSYAKDIAVAQYHAGNDLSTDNILAIADKFNTWLNEN